MKVILEIDAPVLRRIRKLARYGNAVITASPDTSILNSEALKAFSLAISREKKWHNWHRESPNPGNRYLCLLSNGKTQKIAVYFYDRWGWGGNYIGTDFIVKYWMELPSPPEESCPEAE